jgi:hypothetical protein
VQCSALRQKSRYSKGLRLHFSHTSRAASSSKTEAITNFTMALQHGNEAKETVMRVGFEPTPFRTTDNRCFKGYETLTWRLRPLGHLTIGVDVFRSR